MEPAVGVACVDCVDLVVLAVAVVFTVRVDDLLVVFGGLDVGLVFTVDVLQSQPSHLSLHSSHLHVFFVGCVAGPCLFHRGLASSFQLLNLFTHTMNKTRKLKNQKLFFSFRLSIL